MTCASVCSGRWRSWATAVRCPCPAALAQLLLSPGRTIPASMLIDRLWAASTLPVDPTNALQVRVSKLRRSLKANRTPDLVTREGVGYRANVDPKAVDAIAGCPPRPSALRLEESKFACAA